jgi:hypothetical protein
LVRLLAAAYSAMSTWLLHHVGASSSQIAEAYELVSTGLDEDHAFVRRAGADVALIAAGVRLQRQARLAVNDSRHLIERDLAKSLEFIDPRAAALHLARQLTGLADDLLGLVAGDQIGDDRILNCRVPDAALPVLRALDRGFGPALGGRADPGRGKRHAVRPTESDTAATFAWLLESGSADMNLRLHTRCRSSVE